MINSAFLDKVTLQSSTPTFLPFGGSFDNFATVFGDAGFVRALGISLAVTLVTVAAAIVIAFLGALAISRFRFRGRRSFILALLLIQMLPAEGLFIAQYKMISSVGLLNNVLGLGAALHRGRPAVHGLDAARLRRRRAGRAGGGGDGRRAQPHQGLPAVTFPLLAPGLVASGVFAFLQAWNEFTVALVVMTGEQRARCRCGCAVSSRRARPARPTGARSWPASTLVAVPVIIFFLIVQSRMTQRPRRRGGEGLR